MLIPGLLIKPATIAGYVAIAGFLLYVFLACPALANENDRAPLTAETILRESAGDDAPGARITSISSHFLGAPYIANSLIGGPAEAEQLVTRLDGFDCFTFLDTVEALRRSSVAGDFPMQMIQVRYREGVVSYANRRHFFSDWVADQGSPVKDVTAVVSRGRVMQVNKVLNRRSDGAPWVQGAAVLPRTITYIPADTLDAKLLEAIEPGDYVGVFSAQPGLDVSHTGLIVEADGAIMLRHASSRGGVERITDENLLTYMRGRTGLLVYRVMQ